MSSQDHEQAELYEMIQPPDIGPDHAKEGFQAPANPYSRRWCVRIVLPWQDEQPVDAKRTQRPTEPLEERMELLLEYVHHNSLFECIEQLLVPGTNALEIILNPIPRKFSEKPDLEQETFDDSDKTVDSAKKQAGINLANKAILALPDTFGIELVHVDTTKFGQTPVSTYRAVSRDKEGASRAGNLSFNIPYQICSQLKGDGLPFCIQGMLDVADKTPKASFRLVVFDPTAASPAGHSGFAKHVVEDKTYDPHEFLQHVNLTTNQRMRIADYWDITYDPEVSGLNAYSASYSEKVSQPDYRYRQTKPQADQIRKLHTGTAEYERLLRCDDNYNRLYEKLGFYPRFNLSLPQFSYLFAVPPVYYDISPWEKIAYRGGLEITTVAIKREAPGTAQSVGTGTEHAITDTDGDPVSQPTAGVQNDGSTSHITGGIQSVDWFEDHGIEGEELDQDSSSIPDFRLYTDDGKLPPIRRRIGPRPDTDDEEQSDAEEDYIAILPKDDALETDVVEGEVEESVDSKAANMLDNASRAVMLDRAVLFVFSSQEDAEYAIKCLDIPYKRRTDDNAIIPYQSTRKVTLADGSHPVHRARSTEWELIEGDTARATSGEDELAKGPADESVDSFEYQCPRFRKVDGKYVVETPDGDVISEYHSKDRLTDDWTIVRKPHIPIGHTYLPRSIIMYRDGDELRLCEPDPDWDGPDAMDRHEGMLEATVDDLLVEEEDAEIEWDTFREHLNRIYRRKTDWYPPPESHVFGTALNDDIETKRRNNPSRKFVKNRRWIYDPTIVSPDLPGYDEYANTKSATHR